LKLELNKEESAVLRSLIVGVFLFVCATSAPADQVTLKNGDRLTGTIVKSDAKTLLLKTEFAGDVSFQWDAVTSIVSSQTLHLALKDGQTIVGTVTTADGKFEVATKETGPVVATKDAIVGVRNDAEQKAYDDQIERLRHPHLTDFWSGLLDTGLSLTRGNSESLTYSLSGKAARVTDRDKIAVYTTAIYTNSAVNGISSTTAHAIRGGVRGDLNVRDKFFVFGFTDFEYDQFQDLDLRNVIGGGLGYHAIKTKNTTFDVFAGGSYDADFFGAIAATATTPARPAITRKTGEIVVGETFNAKINNRTTLTEQFSLYPNLSDTGTYRFQFDTTAATKLKNWLSWQVTYSDRYLSNPLVGFKKNDLLLSTGVRLTFGKGVF
jgi:putative salt-induced outer membrane protein YdiY